MDSVIFNSVITWILIAAFIGYVWWMDRPTPIGKSRDAGHAPLGSHHSLNGK
jgi:glucose-6-phosphate dehydrogenase assembly protein OpcA